MDIQLKRGMLDVCVLAAIQDEESYGYMLGDYVRDKDAVTASLIITEMAAWYATQGKTLYDALQGLYEKYGWFGE